MANFISKSGSFEWKGNYIVYDEDRGVWSGSADTYQIEFHPSYKYVIGSNMYVYAWPGDDSTDFLASLMGYLNPNYEFWGHWRSLGQVEYDDVIVSPGSKMTNLFYGFFILLECLDNPPEIEYSVGDYSIEGFDAYPDDATITGVVTDYKGNPVEGVTVTYKTKEGWNVEHTGEFEATTDVGGQYEIIIEADDTLAHDDYDWPNVKKIKDDLIVWGTASAPLVEDEEYFAIEKDIELGFQDEKTQDFQLKQDRLMIGSVIVNCTLYSKRVKPFEIGKAGTNLIISRPLKLTGSNTTNAILNVDDGLNRLKGSVITSGVLLSSDYVRICYVPDVIISMTNMISSANEWVVADNLEEDISIWVSFPEPEYVPAYLVSGQKKYKKQTFEMKVRKSIDNKVDPVIQIYYYSDGMPISKSRKIKIISTKGQIVKWHWFIESNFEKKHVQCKVSSFSYNYGPVNKCGVDIDYITWCGVYDLLANP